MEGLVESLSNEFIVGFASPYSSTSQALIDTTDDQRNFPFLVNLRLFIMLGTLTIHLLAFRASIEEKRFRQKRAAKWLFIAGKKLALRFIHQIYI